MEENRVGHKISDLKRSRLLKALVSLLLISFILANSNLSDIAESFRHADAGMLVIAGLLTFVGATITASRWRTLLKIQAVNANLGYLIGRWMVACFFNQFLPSTIGGDARRIYDSWKLGATKAGATAAIGVDRILGLFVLMMYGTVSLVLSSFVFDEQVYLRWLVVGVSLFLLFLSYVIFAKRTFVDGWATEIVEKLPLSLRGAATKFLTAIGEYRGQTRVLFLALLLSLVLQFNVILFYFLIGRAFNLDLVFIDYMLVVPVASVILLIPITINGIGLREGVFVLLLGGLGVTSSVAIAFAWASFALFTLFGLLGGIVYALQGDPEPQ